MTSDNKANKLISTVEKLLGGTVTNLINYVWSLNNLPANFKIQIYIFKHIIKDDERKDKNDKLERKLKKFSNIAHVFDPFFYTTQKLLKNCNEVVFLSNKSLFIFW